MLTVMPFLNNNSFSPLEAKAVLEYGMDNYKKYKDNSNVEEIIECSNTNVNNNGFNGVQASDEGEVGASSSESDGGGPSGSDSDSSVVCISNNNNGVIKEPMPPTPPTPPPTEDFLDLAVANFLSDDVSILLGDDNGTFTEEPTESPITVGDEPQSVAVGDFDGDDVLDLAVANEDSNNVSILLGDGDGTFTQAAESPITVGDEPQSVAVGDFDGDDVLDLAVPNGGSDNISILLGDGDGTFTQAAESPVTVGDHPFSVAVGDFDGDDVLDLAVTNEDSNNVSILLGDGNGTFTEEPTESPVTVGDAPVTVAVGDFDGDDVLDLAVTNQGSNNVSILLGDGDGTFTQATESPITVGDFPFSVAVGDFDGDDVLDLAVANVDSDDVSILLGDGDGTFTEEPTESPITAVGDGPFSFAVEDFDGDDVLDLAVGNVISDDVSILLGDGDGTFTQAADSPITVGLGPFSVAVGNFN
jgi:hypothetical protein